MSETTEFVVNGTACVVEEEPNAVLLHVLRNRLGLTATRFGCGVNQCGACHVIVDGHAVASCDTPLWAVAGKQVTTLEGLGSREAPHPLQQALIDEQAMQCGYCIAGVTMTAAALLQQNAAPTEAEVRTALDRNLCRCGSHNRIVRAVMKAASVPNPKFAHTLRQPGLRTSGSKGTLES